MAKISFTDRDNLLREIEIEDEIVTVGREATNKLVIADPSVSRQHATIEKRPDGYYLIDKNSSNGTFVNGKKISQQKLAHNDKLNFGSASVVFEDEEHISATFVLPKDEVLEPPKAEEMMTQLEERPTDALSSENAEEPSRGEPLLPPPPPMNVARPPEPPPPPPKSQPSPPPFAAPPKPAPVPESHANLCPSCKKEVEPGARFCAFCGASLAAAAKPAAAQPSPQPPPPVAKPVPSPVPPAAPVAPPPPKPAAPVPPPRIASEPPAPAVRPVQSKMHSSALEYVGFGPRLLAYLLDQVIVTFVTLIICSPGLLMMLSATMRNEEPSPFAMVVLVGCALLGSIFGLFYYVYLTGAKGATLGKKLLKMKVALPDGSHPIGYGKAFLRLIGYMVSALICYIGFLMIAFDKEQHRGLHDKIAGTIVIKEA